MYDAWRLSPCSGSPDTAIRPLEGLASPAIRFNTVDFPQPLGPTIDRNDPAATSSVMSRTASYAPKDFETDSSEIALEQRPGFVEDNFVFFRDSQEVYRAVVAEVH